jgi:purine-binding chemotaxis protein CheW
MSTDDGTKETKGKKGPKSKAATRKSSSKSTTKKKAGSAKPKKAKTKNKATTRKSSSASKIKKKAKSTKSKPDVPKAKTDHAGGAPDGRKQQPEEELAPGQQDAKDKGQTPLSLPADEKVTAIADLGETASTARVSKVQEVVCFELDGQLYGLPVEQVIEVTRMVAVTELPKTPTGMLGVINFRGDIIPLLDLRQVLGLRPQRFGLSTPIVVAGSPGKPVGLIVDAIEGVRTLPAKMPSNELFSDVQHVSAVAKIEEDLLLVIDLELLQSRFVSDWVST